MKYVLVTGASTGIGYSICQHLLQNGYAVFGSVRKEADAKRLQAEFSDNFVPLLFDVSDYDAIHAARKVVEQQLEGQPLAGLVNNAGIAVFGPIQHLAVSEWKRQFDVNVFGVVAVTQAFLPLLGARQPQTGPPGKIINISSVSGQLSMPFLGPYAASKHALEALTDSLRRELLIYGIDVVSILPGPVRTPIWEKSKNQEETFPSTDYGKVLVQMKSFISETEQKAIDPVRIADCVRKILQKKQSKTRYIISADAWSHRLITRLVPDRWADGFVRRMFLKVYSKIPIT
ncbi:MAG: SDR family oxidoreductase [Bacteroidota bacterium]